MQFTVDTDLAAAGIVLGVAAIAMATPPFIQMLCGRPNLMFGVDDFIGPDRKSLLITMKNKTTQKRFLKKIGVVREVGDVTASFSTQQHGTNLFVAKDISGSLHNAVLRESGLMVRAFPGRTIGLTVIHFQGGAAYVVDARSQNLNKIAPGDYFVDAVIFCGEQIYFV